MDDLIVKNTILRFLQQPFIRLVTQNLLHKSKIYLFKKAHSSMWKVFIQLHFTKASSQSLFSQMIPHTSIAGAHFSFLSC